MSDYKIRLGHTDSVNSVDRENLLDVELKNTSKKLHFNDVKKTVDQYEQFQAERDKCNRFRLILTINPFCSNVLFNPFTEMVKYRDEGNGRWSCEHIFSNEQTLHGLDGNETPKRVQMIADTSYSNTEGGYIYYPGYDMFDNHIIRNKSFKVVMPARNSADRDIFNTIADVVRDENGNKKKVWVRVNGLDNQPVNTDLHLYADQDILSFEDSINSNLYEENGWFGFVNHSNLLTTKGEPLHIEKVLNNREACEFVDMYPNRELFSFNPTYNPRYDRLEYNWDIVLTYPYENVYNNNIISGTDTSGGRVEGLKVMEMLFVDGNNNEKVTLIRSYVKHNLKRNDTIIMYLGIKSGNNNYDMINNVIKVRSIGDLSGNNEEHYFCIAAFDIMDGNVSKTGIASIAFRLIEILQGSGSKYDEYFTIDDVTYLIDIAIHRDSLSLNDLHEEMYIKKKGEFGDESRAMTAADVFLDLVFESLVFRFAHVVNGEKSRYYIRKFRKLPNFKKKHRDVTPYDLENRENFEDYVNKNAVFEFDREFYKLGFATTIYGDECAQITYTDTIDVGYLTDNLGRPLSEIYATIIKRNVGSKKWYENEQIGNSDLVNIEQSCCFTDSVSGLDISVNITDSSFMLDERSYESDIHLLKRTNNTDKIRALERERTGKAIPIKEGNETFYGDIVEFSPTECVEYVLSEVNYRFNTYQRDNPIRLYDGEPEDDTLNEMPFIYHEISSDDYDFFKETSERNTAFSIEQISTDPQHSTLVSQKRDEGYFHKAHYQIKLHDFGDVNQASHYDISVREATPVQSDNIFIKVKTNIPHKLNKGDTVLLCDDENGFVYRFSCTYIDSRNSFYIIPVKSIGEDVNEWAFFKTSSSRFYNTPLTWLSVTQYLREGIFTIRKENHDIPDYAVKIGKNTYLWRNILPIGDKDSTTVPEYPYTNNAFYISKTIDFFLKRQDPDGSNHLYAKDTFPNDVYGKILKTSKYEYKDKIVPVC